MRTSAAIIMMKTWQVLLAILWLQLSCKLGSFWIWKQKDWRDMFLKSWGGETRDSKWLIWNKLWEMCKGICRNVAIMVIICVWQRLWEQGSVAKMEWSRVLSTWVLRKESSSGSTAVTPKEWPPYTGCDRILEEALSPCLYWAYKWRRKEEKVPK